jgi:hypothetical protein
MTETASSAVPETLNAPTGDRSAYGFGVATIATGNGDATVLDVWFPAPALGTAAENLRAVENADEALAQIAEAGTDADRGTEQKVVFVQIDLDEAPADTATCACTCSRTAWSGPTPLTWTGSSASCPTSSGPTSARPLWRASS